MSTCCASSGAWKAGVANAKAAPAATNASVTAARERRRPTVPSGYRPGTSASGSRSIVRARQRQGGVGHGGEAVTTNGVIDESFLMRYRVLLDEEAAAFDELEHAYEDGDREHFRADLR